MKIDHCAIYLNNLEQGKEFFEKYFGVNCSDRYHNKKTGFQSYFLSFEDGSRLEIMTRENLGNPGFKDSRSGFAHIAISVGSKEEVDLMTERFRSDGYHIVSGPRITGDGYYETCLLDSEGNQIEITV